MIQLPQHWLPVQSRIIFKLLLLVYKALNDKAPSYISILLSHRKFSQWLRSSGRELLTLRLARLKDLLRPGVQHCCTMAMWWLASYCSQISINCYFVKKKEKEKTFAHLSFWRRLSRVTFISSTLIYILIICKFVLKLYIFLFIVHVLIS